MKILFFTVLLLAQNLMASEVGSQFLHQTASGTWEVTPSINYSDYTIKFTSANAPLTQVETTGPVFQAQGEYGINDMFSVGVVLGYSSSTATYSPSSFSGSTSKGLSDPQIYFNGRAGNLGPGALRYGLQLDISPGNQTIDSSGNANSYSGGSQLQPNVAYEMYSGTQTFGLKLGYNFVLSKYSYANSAGAGGKEIDYTKTGGQTTQGSIFWEMNLQPWTLGAAFSYESVASTSTTLNGVTQNDNNSNNGWALQVYAPYRITPNILLFPVISYVTISTANLPNVSSANGWDVALAARFAF